MRRRAVHRSRCPLAYIPAPHCREVEKNFEERFQEYVNQFRGKRTDPQSRPGNSTLGARPGTGSRTTRMGAPPARRAPRVHLRGPVPPRQWPCLVCRSLAGRQASPARESARVFEVLFFHFLS